jgi:O-antigen/teichoic acid export membrane protein
MQIGKRDVMWNYIATFLKMGVGVILLPFVVSAFPQEMVAIWTIFSTTISFIALLDFGFSPTFSRNVSYVVSGVKELKITGYQIINNKNTEIDYSLFKGLINAMGWFYARMALLLFGLLATVGTYYIHTVLKTYTGDHNEVYISWIILCAVNTYTLYTYYYDALMQGMGLIKRSYQIQVVAYLIYLLVAISLIILRFNLIAIVSAQTLMVVLKRILAYYSIFTPEFNRLLRNVVAQGEKKIIKIVFPNAVKFGLNSLANFLIFKSANIIAPLYFSLNIVASYGITIQIVDIIGVLSGIYYSTYQPKIAQYRILNNMTNIKRLYLQSCAFMLLILVVFGAGLFFAGDWALEMIKSKTTLLSKSFIAMALFVYLLEKNNNIARGIISTKNELPFYKAALYTGVATVILLLVLLKYTSLGVWGLIILPGVTQIIYHAWKWPIEAMKELKIIPSKPQKKNC